MKLEKNHFFKYNTSFALMIGICCVAASFFAYMSSNNIYHNPTLAKSISFLYIIGLYFQIRRYRNSGDGYLSYRHALTTGIWIATTVSFIYAAYTFIIYSADPEMLNNYIKATDSLLHEVYSDNSLADSLSKMMQVFTNPMTLAISELFSKFISGTIYSLVLALPLQRKQVDQ